MHRILIRRENFKATGGTRYLNTEVIMEACSNITCDFHTSIIKPRYPKAWGTAKCPDCGMILCGGDLASESWERVDYHLEVKG